MSKIELLRKIITFWLEVRICSSKQIQNKLSHPTTLIISTHVYSKVNLVT